MNQKILVSITISTFNVSRYIKSSIFSILSQSYRSFELICIDDGSTDGTYEILREFEKNDSRVKVLRNESNRGLAYNRNLSLQLANGQYVMFVDGDDIMHSTLVEKAVELAERNCSDLVMWDYHTFSEDYEIKTIKINESSFNEKRNGDKEYLLERPAFTWTKLIRTSAARELNINFPLGLTRQDIPVHWHLITALNNIEILPEKLSFYRQQPNATTAQSDKRVFDLIFVTNIVKSYLKKSSLYDNHSDQFIKHQINFMYGILDKIDRKYLIEAENLVEENMTIEHKMYIFSDKSLRWQAREYFKMKEGDCYSYLKFKLWYALRYVYRHFKQS